MPRTSRPRRIGIALALLGVLASGGCSGPERPADASPIVDADSDQARRAQIEADQFLKLRQQQEAAARKRSRSLPAEG